MIDGRLAWALVAVIVRYLTTIQHLARGELARWRQQASAINDPALRAALLLPYDSDMSAEGAALFAVIHPRRRHQLVPLLVAYVLLWSCVDVLSERDPAAGAAFYDALTDALRPEALPIRSYRTDLDDGGYLDRLVAACRAGCHELPSWGQVQPAALRIARDGTAVQAINHGDPKEQGRALRAWAASRPEVPGSRWNEQAAAASSPLAIHALLALAADPAVTTGDVEATTDAYVPWMAALSTIADHYIDADDDGAERRHSFLAYYGSLTEAGDRVVHMAATAARCVRLAPYGERHAVILACMTTMFFTNPNAWTPERAATSMKVVRSVGLPARSLRVAIAAKRWLLGGHRHVQVAC